MQRERRPTRTLRAEHETVARPGIAAGLSALLPGFGQMYDGRWRRGAIALLVPLGTLTLIVTLAFIIDPLSGALIRRAQIVVTLLVGGALAYHLLVVGDAFAGTAGASALLGRRPRQYAMLGASVVVLVVLYGALYQQSSAWAGLAARVFTPPPPAVSVAPAAPEAPPAWSGSERLNVLLLGVDSRGPNDTDQNTDTLIVLTLDPVNQTAGMLSIPRDTLVNIKGVFGDKINAAYAVGGPDLARRAVEGLLGVRIHAWALFNFDAFTKIVDGAGGALIDVRRPMRDELYPTAAFGVRRLAFLAGPQLMAGSSALSYARTRHGSNDYDRSERQQEVLAALRTRLVEGNLLLRIPAIMDSVAGAVRTNFDPSNVLPVARLGSGLDRAQIQSEVLLPCTSGAPHCELTEDNGPGGFYLIPNRSKVGDLAARIFYDPRVRRDGATIEVRGAGQKKDAVATLAERLTGRGFIVSGTTEAPAAKTAVYLRNGSKRATAEVLAAELGLPTVSSPPSGEASGADVVVVIGTDYRGLAADR